MIPDDGVLRKALIKDGVCLAAEERFEPSDCNDEDPKVHPQNVEWMGDGEDWDCDGLDAPELCLDDGLDWLDELPESCDEGSLVIQRRQTCDVCSGTETYVLLRVVSAVEPSYRMNELLVVTDWQRVYRLQLSDFDGTTPMLAVPARFGVDARLRFGGCDDPDGFVSQPTRHSSCTL